MGTPRKVRSDLGKEFTSLKTEEYFKSIGVKHFTPQGEAKSNYVERVIRTLRSLIHRSSKKARSFRYIYKLESLVRNYNITPHKSLGYKAPAEINKGNAVDQTIDHYLTPPPIVSERKNLKKSGKIRKPSSPFRFKVNDTVRISHLKHPFEREFMEKFTGELFEIKSRF